LAYGVFLFIFSVGISRNSDVILLEECVFFILRQNIWCRGSCLSNSCSFYYAAGWNHAFSDNTSNSWEFAIGVSECTEMIYWCIGNGIRHISYTDQLLAFISMLKVSAVVYSHGLTLRITSLLKQQIEWKVKLKLFNFNQS